MSFTNDIKHGYKNATIAEKLIYINLVLFILTLFTRDFIINWFALSSNFENFISKPWTILSYSIIHSSFSQIFLNLLFLYFLGNLFLDFFTQKQFLNYFILGTLVGGMFYLILNPGNYLVGASSGVMAILIGLTTKIPTYEIRLNLIGGVKIWVISLIYIIVSITGLNGFNSGGNIAHLGGALLGFIYTKQLDKGNDIGRSFEKIIDFFANMFKSKNKQTLRTVHKNSNIKRKPSHKESNLKQKQIDSILDKISKSGYESLTKQEKDFLFKAGKK